MYARWASFGVGLALLLAPLALGYASVVPILHDVAIGSLVCIATLAAIEWPRARFASLAPGLWLVAVGASWEGPAATVELVAGVLLVVLAAIPHARRAVPGVAGSQRARA
jgi:hypothetical protein